MTILNKLVLDDKFTTIQRNNITLAINDIKENGIQKNLTFEYDLGKDESGEEKNGYDLARWLVNSAFDGSLAFPDDFKYELNTQNFTIEKHQVSSLFNNYLYFRFVYN